MIKTQMDIERYFYGIVKASDLGKAIGGTVYRYGMRPDNAKTEDIIVGLLSGIDGQQQDGIVLVNVFVPDKAGRNGKKEPDYGRIATLQAYKEALISDCQKGDFYVARSKETERAIAVENNQQCFTIRLNFRTITD